MRERLAPPASKKPVGRVESLSFPEQFPLGFVWEF